jgi:hypothetical protein
MPAATVIKLRGGSAAEWALANPVLDVHEPGFEEDTGILRIGDGVTAFVDLPGIGALPDLVDADLIQGTPPGTAAFADIITDATLATDTNILSAAATVAWVAGHGGSGGNPTMGGDLTGTASNATVTKIGGTVVGDIVHSMIADFDPAGAATGAIDALPQLAFDTTYFDVTSDGATPETVSVGFKTAIASALDALPDFSNPAAVQSTIFPDGFVLNSRKLRLREQNQLPARRLKAAIARAAGAAPGKLLWIGDSIPAGAGTPTNIRQRISNRLKDVLCTASGTDPLSVGYLQAINTVVAWSPTQTGTWINGPSAAPGTAAGDGHGNGFGLGRHSARSASGSTSSLTFSNVACDRFTLDYYLTNAGGSFTIKIDGVLVATIDTHQSAAGPTLATPWDSGALTAQNHTIRIDTVQTNGTYQVDIGGIMPYWDNFSGHGWQLWDATHSGDPAWTPSGSELAMIADIQPNVCIISYGSNDYLYGQVYETPPRTPADSAAYLVNTVTAIQGVMTGGNQCAFIYVNMWGNPFLTSEANYKATHDAMFDACYEHGIGYVDIYEALGWPATVCPDLCDGVGLEPHVHPSAAGTEAMLNEVVQQLDIPRLGTHQDRYMWPGPLGGQISVESAAGLLQWGLRGPGKTGNSVVINTFGVGIGTGNVADGLATGWLIDGAVGTQFTGFDTLKFVTRQGGGVTTSHGKIVVTELSNAPSIGPQGTSDSFPRGAFLYTAGLGFGDGTTGRYLLSSPSTGLLDFSGDTQTGGITTYLKANATFTASRTEYTDADPTLTWATTANMGHGIFAYGANEVWQVAPSALGMFAGITIAPSIKNDPASAIDLAGVTAFRANYTKWIDTATSRALGTDIDFLDTPTYFRSNAGTFISGTHQGFKSVPIMNAPGCTLTAIQSIVLGADIRDGTVTQRTAILIQDPTISGTGAFGSQVGLDVAALSGFAVGIRTAAPLQLTDTNLILGTTTGTKIGTATNQKLAFFNKTPIVQPASANQAAETQTPTVAGASYVQATAATWVTNLTQLNTLVNQIRTDLVNVGLIKGSA